MVDLAGSGRGALRSHAREGMRRPGSGRASRHPQRPRLPLQMAWVGCDLREERPHQEHVGQGMLPGQLRHGGFHGRPENESFYGRDWSGVGLSEFIEMLDAYLRYYNEARPKEQLGWMSPMQYRRSLGLAA